MVDRMDIDALLIGSLYGELTPADEARLHAHLESHPADRTVLSDLTRARQAVRESRIFELQLEPPQAVSALLLQEAARRAPRVARTAPERDEPSWFQRFVRAFAAHPALAAACTVVVVIGVATMLYVRNGGAQFAEVEVEPRSIPTAPSAAAESAPATGQQVAQPPQAVEGAKDEYKVGLGDQQRDPHAGAPAAPTEAAPEPTTPPAKKPAGTSAASEDKGQRSSKKRDYIEVDRPSPTPKELGETSKAKLAMEKEAKETQRRSAEERLETRKGNVSTPPADATPATGHTPPATTSSGATGAPGRAAGGAGSGATGSASPGLSVGGATAPAPGPATNRVDTNSKDVRRQPASPAPQAPAASPPPPPPASDATVTRDRSADKNDTKADKPAEDITWARAEHDRVIASVKANKCMDAANRALVIESRTPAYYAQNVANDRAIKSCVSYITAERSRRIEAEKKASRAKATERRADEPAKPATTNK